VRDRQPAAFYDHVLDMLVMPAPQGVSAEHMNAIELAICAHPNAVWCRWFDVPTSQSEG